MQLEILDKDEGLSFDEFKCILEPELKKVVKSSIEKRGFENTLR